MRKAAPKKTSAKRAVKTKKQPIRTRSTRATPAARSTAQPARKAHAPIVHNSLGELIDKLGDQVEPVLYALLCEDKHKMRSTFTGALGKGSQAATLALIPLLVTQFALTPALAAVVVGTLAKALMSKGPEALCEELSKSRAERLKKQQPAAKRAASTASKKPRRAK